MIVFSLYVLQIRDLEVILENSLRSVGVARMRLEIWNVTYSPIARRKNYMFAIFTITWLKDPEVFNVS